MAGYDIDGIEPGAGAGGGGSDAPDLTESALTDATAYPATDLYGWSIQNTTAGLSTVYIRLGNSAAATPFIAINLAENETVTQIFEHPISNATGFFVTVEAGAVDGILYTS